MSDIEAVTPFDPSSAKEADLKSRLAKAQLRLSAATTKRDELEESSALQIEVERAEQAAKDQEALANLEAEHGAKNIATISTEMGLIVLKRCGTLRYRRFQDQDNSKTEDVEKLVGPCVIHPNRARFNEIMERLPGALVPCANQIARLAGVKIKEVEGK